MSSSAGRERPEPGGESVAERLAELTGHFQEFAQRCDQRGALVEEMHAALEVLRAAHDELRHTVRWIQAALRMRVERLDRLEERLASLEARAGPPAAAAPAAAAPEAGPPPPADAPPPLPTPAMIDILATLRGKGQRLTTALLLSALQEAGFDWSDSTIKHTLPLMVRAGWLDNDPRATPPGYGLRMGPGTE
jgi:hypothetical protein